jgi:hypothetical protein
VLTSFTCLERPITAAEMCQISGTQLFFKQVMFPVDKETGKRLVEEAKKRK